MCFVRFAYIFVILCNLYDEKYLPDIRKHCLLVSSVFGSSYCSEKLLSLMKKGQT
jgi:hypothetical protein